MGFKLVQPRVITTHGSSLGADLACIGPNAPPTSGVESLHLIGQPGAREETKSCGLLFSTMGNARDHDSFLSVPCSLTTRNGGGLDLCHVALLAHSVIVRACQMTKQCLITYLKDSSGGR
jgi:hypothetical protein